MKNTLIQSSIIALGIIVAFVVSGLVNSVAPNANLGGGFNSSLAPEMITFASSTVVLVPATGSFVPGGTISVASFATTSNRIYLQVRATTTAPVYITFNDERPHSSRIIPVSATSTLEFDADSVYTGAFRLSSDATSSASVLIGVLR